MKEFKSGLSNADYHGGTGISSSSFKEFLKSPAHYKAYRDYPPTQTPAMRLGELVHARVLEKKTPLLMPTFSGEGMKARKAAWLAENSGKPACDADDMAVINGIGSSVDSHGVISHLLSEGEAEKSAYARCPMSGLLLKARYDWLRPDGVIIDLKTSKNSAKPESFEKTIFNFGYHISAAWYAYVYELVTGEKMHSFVLIAAEKKAPFAVSAFRLKDEVIQLGRDLIIQKLPTLAECIETGSFPGYSQLIREVGIPSWGMDQTESLILEGEEVA